MAGIIKAAERTPPAGASALAPFHFDDVGQSYLARVRAEAARVVAEARQEAAKIKARATEEGRQAAIQAAQASLRTRLDQQLASVLATLRQAAQNIEHARHAWQQHWEQHAVALAVAIATRLCRREISRQPQITLQWIREALELAVGNAEISLRLNPADHESLAAHIEPITRQLTGLGTVRVIADPTIAAGGCRVDTEFGSLDLQLEVQVARITEELLS
jgi:flagellar biosynthesis/type III secretory pathway protein FliH